MKFSIALPNAIEGMATPIPFADHTQLIDIAVLSEKLGFDAVWGCDHLLTQKYVKDTFDTPPNYYEVLITLAVLSTYTKKLRLGTCILVLPIREPVLLANQLATLDQFNDGRLTVGIGVGGYREEFEAIYPERGNVHRGNLLEETVQALNLVFTEREASFSGKYVQFKGVEAYPKPKQKKIPFYFGGNSIKAIERTARWGDAWMPAGLTPEDLKKGIQRLERFSEKYPENKKDFEIAPQYNLYLAENKKKAAEYFRNSQSYEHILSLKDSTNKNINIEETYVEGNLFGSPQEVIDKIGQLKDAGMTHCTSICIDTHSIEEMYEQMHRFAEEVMPAFK